MASLSRSDNAPNRCSSNWIAALVSSIVRPRRRKEPRLALLLPVATFPLGVGLVAAIWGISETATLRYQQ